MQNKDVIYIDVEDDITAIIGKVKTAKQKIVALVPPKRTGVLQSAVNLKLLARAAGTADKRLVLITGNAALSSLAASAEIPVAKTLQSRPELAKVAEVKEEEEDVIEGGELPVGDHASSTKVAKQSAEEAAETAAVVESINDIDIDGESAPLTPKPEKKESSKRGAKVPDFGSFRKKMAIGVGAGLVVILFLFWAFAIAPHATVVVSAKTTGQYMTTPVTLGSDLETDSTKTTIKSIEQTDKASQSVDFDATGTKDVGAKATGTVQFSSTSTAYLGTTIPAGTKLTGSGQTFVTTESVTFTLGDYKGPSTGFAVTTGVEASASGDKYNGISGSVSGAPSGVTSQITGPTSGGTSKVIKIVTQSDIDKATEQLQDEKSNDAKKKLKSKFKATDIIIDSSFKTTGGDPVASPAVGQEASTGKAKLTSDVTYTMSAVAKDEMNSYLDDAFKKLLTSPDSQRVYDNGLSTVTFADFEKSDPNDSANLTATAQVGPKINDENIKDQSKGKRTGEVIGDLKAIDGVSDVEVKLSPFWVTGIPDDVKKISVDFKLIKND